MSRIELKKINKYYGDVHVLKDVDLTVEKGDFMTLLGPSGCGKTTTLRVIAGLEAPRSGIITIDDIKVADGEALYNMPPAKRGVNLVFQSYALWPHMTVNENVAFGLTIHKTPKNEIAAKVKDALDLMRIAEYADRYPSELSGGQQQRVAIARSIVSRPKILLLDEPLSNLDAKLRIEMRSELKRLYRDLGTTVVYVTHDQVEALTMSTKIAIFFEGRIVQVDSPCLIYANPTNRRVAEFIGNPSINFIDCEVSRNEDSVVVDSGLGRIILDDIASRNRGTAAEKAAQSSLNGQAVIALRPEHIMVKREYLPDSIEARIYSAMPAGSETLIYCAVGNTMVLAKAIGQEEFSIDQKIWITIQKEKINLYSIHNGELILGAIA